MLLRFAGARASTRHAGRQLSCSDGDKSQRYAEARDPPHITRCALPAQPCHPDKNSQYGIPAPTSWVSGLLPASDSLTPSEILGLTPNAFGPHARCITLGDKPREGQTRHSAISHPLKSPNGPGLNRWGTSVPSYVAALPRRRSQTRKFLIHSTPSSRTFILPMWDIASSS